VPSTLAPAAAQPEPTLRDVLDAVTGLGTRMDRFEIRMDGLESKVDRLENRMDGLEIKVDRLENRMDGLETKVDGLATKVDRLEDRMVSVEHEIKGLKVFVGEQFAHSTTEIAKLRAADEEHRLAIEAHGARIERIDVKLDELITLGMDNQRIGLKNQQDIAGIDRSLDAHVADHEIHLPRPRSADVPEIGPMAA
jgi:chromosome segregation ATPase